MHCGTEMDGGVRGDDSDDTDTDIAVMFLSRVSQVLKGLVMELFMNISQHFRVYLSFVEFYHGTSIASDSLLHSCVVTTSTQ